MDHPEIGPINRAAVVEAFEVGHSCGIDFTTKYRIAHVRAFATRMPDTRPSALQDIEAGQPSEVDVINGAIPRAAARVGLAAPVETMLTGLVKARERTIAPARFQPDRPALTEA